MANDELHFEIVFLTSPGRRRFFRVIVVDDIETAEKVAKAMLGEALPGDQKLQSVERVQLTSRAAGLGVFDEAKAKEIWELALHKLGIDPAMVTCLHDIVYGVREIVGFTGRKPNAEL